MDAFQDLNDLYFFAKGCRLRQLYGCCRGARHADPRSSVDGSGHWRRSSACALLNRTTRKLSLTEAGQTLARHCVCADCRSRGRKGCDQPNVVRTARAGSAQLPPPACVQGGVADILAGYLAAVPRSSGRTRGDPIDESTSSMRASISRFGVRAASARPTPTWRCGHSVRRT